LQSINVGARIPLRHSRAASPKNREFITEAQRPQGKELCQEILRTLCIPCLRGEYFLFSFAALGRTAAAARI